MYRKLYLLCKCNCKCNVQDWIGSDHNNIDCIGIILADCEHLIIKTALQPVSYGNPVTFVLDGKRPKKCYPN